MTNVTRLELKDFVLFSTQSVLWSICAVWSVVHQMKMLCLLRILQRAKPEWPASPDFKGLHIQFRRENVLIRSHKCLICGETLAQSLCTFGSLIHCAAGVCRECRLFGAAEHSTIMCEACVTTSVGSGSLFELVPFKRCYPEGFFLSQNKLQMTAESGCCNFSKARRRRTGGSRSTFSGGAGNIASHDRRRVNSGRVVSQQGQSKQKISMMNFRFRFFLHSFRTAAHKKCKCFWLCAAEMSLLALSFSLCLRTCFFYSIPPYSSPHEDGVLPSPLWHSWQIILNHLLL